MGVLACVLTATRMHRWRLRNWTIQMAEAVFVDRNSHADRGVFRKRYTVAIHQSISGGNAMHRALIGLVVMSCLSLNLSFVHAGEAPSYSVMGTDLAALRADFNANADKVRLVFLPSPA